MVSAILCPIGTIQCMTGTTVSRNRKHSKNSVSHQISRISSVHPNRTLALRSFSIFNFEIRKRNSYIENGLILHRLSASLGNEVAVQDPNSEVVQATEKDGGLDNPSEHDKLSESGALPEDESVAAEASSSSVQSKSTETIMKNEIPKVLDEKLVPGATFKGRVRRIQTFGAFIDIGASTDGLVHISRLSDNFVKEVGDVVSVGQEVTVRIVEANLQAGRIALSMKSSDDPSQLRQKQASDPNSAESSSKSVRSRKTPGRSRNNKREETQKSSKFHKGQILEGKVKNKNRSGAFISLPDGEEGYLRTSSNVAGDMGPKFGQPGNSGGDMGLKVGQDVTVRVLRIEKGRVELGMENEEDMDSSNMLLNPSTTVSASNAFAMAFRKIPAISTVLEEKERLQKSATEEKLEEAEDQKLEEQAEERESVVRSAGEEAAFTEEVDEKIVGKGVTEIAENIKKEEGSETLETNDALTNGSAEQVDDFSTLSNEQAPTSETSGKDVSEVKQDEMKVVNSASAEITSSLENDPAQGKDTKGLEISELKDASSINNAGALQESSTLSVEEIGSSEVKDNKMIATDSAFADEKDVLTTNPAEVNDPISDSQTSKPTSEVDLKEVSSGEANTPVNGSSWPATKTETNTNSSTNVAFISAALVKQLREETGAGMMDCKKALTETVGDLEKAREFLRKKGLASAEKKASRIAAEGRIGSYIHDSRIGVLIEVNCETDFVSRGEIFKEIVEDMAMQVTASPQVQYVSLEDVPEDIVKKEKEIELQKEDLLNKPEQIREKIVEGRIGKILGELSLLEQPYIKNDKIIVKDWIKQSIATVGENIRVRRFVRYNLGEGLQKKSQDFASEVAAQTAAKPSPSTLTEKPGAGAESSSVLQEDKPAVEKQTVLISAALVKQLREETGSGMMDCKKALTETGGDLEKAQEFLRKKGLASADKKSGRIAAEGRVGSYIHDSRIGVLIEVNSETDFVARGDIFKQLVEDLAMQVAACPQVQYVAIEDVPKDVADKEREIEMQREDLLAKPANIREKIVEGRITKRLSELVLLEQPFIRDDSLLVKDIVKQAIASLGENIRVRRFVRYNLGEGIEKETKDLAAEIAKQTTLKT